MQLRATLYKLILTLATIGLLSIITIGLYPYLKGPDIQINEIKYTESNKEMIEISGTAKRAITLEINGRRIYANGNNNFKDEFPRRYPSTMISIIATDKFNKTITIDREFK